MKFELKDKSWGRYDLFYYYINNLRCVLSMTCDIDISYFLPFVKNKNYRFYPAMMWAVSKILNSREEFKLGWNNNNQVGVYDIIHPYFAHFYKEDEKCAKLVVKYNNDLSIFHSRFINITEKYKTCRAFDYCNIPKNTFDVSCLPWINYKNFDMHIFDEGKYLAPVVTWGKYTESDGKITIPVSFNLHHACVDGYHLSRFFLELQEFIDIFSQSKE